MKPRAVTAVDLLLTVLVLGVIVIAVTVTVGALAGGVMRGEPFAVAWMRQRCTSR